MHSHVQWSPPFRRTGNIRVTEEYNRRQKSSRNSQLCIFVRCEKSVSLSIVGIVEDVRTSTVVSGELSVELKVAALQRSLEGVTGQEIMLWRSAVSLGRSSRTPLSGQN